MQHRKEPALVATHPHAPINLLYLHNAKEIGLRAHHRIPSGGVGIPRFFPALPGCHSWGTTYEQAVKNAEEALIGFLEALQKNGESIPEGDQPAGEVSLGVFVNLPAQL
jgi:hypothetical protein